MQQFDDFKLPDEKSMLSLQQGYANKMPFNKVNTLDSEPTPSTNLQSNTIFNNINWQQNRQLLRLLQNQANNRCARNFIRGIIPLNEQDFEELNGFFANPSLPRLNPIIQTSIPNTFNSALREYIRDDLNLIDSLLQIYFIESEEGRRNSIYNIIRRRLNALDTLASFLSGGIFG